MEMNLMSPDSRDVESTWQTLRGRRSASWIDLEVPWTI